MYSSKEEEKQQLQKKLYILYITMSIPSLILSTLGLYAVLVADGDAIIGLLNNKNIAYGTLIVGVAGMILASIKMFPLMQRKMQLENEENNT